MKRIFIGVVVAVSLAVCSVALATTSRKATGAKATSPNGTWKETLHTTALSGHLNGTWTLKLAQGAYHVSDNGHAIVHGNYTIKGGKISFKDTGGSGKCPGTGVYRFVVTRKSLEFALVKDKNAACIGRRDVLTAGVFTKS